MRKRNNEQPAKKRSVSAQAKNNKKRMAPYALIAPVLFFILIVYGYPLIMTWRYSFQKVSLLGEHSQFVGLMHYITLLKDPVFYETLWRTLRWTVLTIGLKIGIGFLIALLLNANIYMKKIYQFLLLIPWAIPQVVVGIVWGWILDGRYGTLNFYLQKFGVIKEAVYWLSEPGLAFFSASFVDAWIGIPLVTMIFLSGLHAIPIVQYEAAKVDGANAWQRFLYVTLPGMKKILWITTILTTIWSFNAFNVIYVLTGGGPMRATETMVMRIHKEVFGRYHLGLGAAWSVLVCLILTIWSLLYWRQLQKGEAHEA